MPPMRPPGYAAEDPGTSTDLMTLFYAFDEYTDVEDETTTRQMADIVMDGLRNPTKPRPNNECFLGEMARQ